MQLVYLTSSNIMDYNIIIFTTYSWQYKEMKVRHMEIVLTRA